MGEPDLHQAAGLVQPKLAEDGCFYLRARWMDPTTGMFVSEDPYEGNMSYPLSLHRFLYASGNPIDYCDPTGEFTTLGEALSGVANYAMLATRVSVAFGRKFVARIVTKVVYRQSLSFVNNYLNIHVIGGAGFAQSYLMAYRYNQAFTQQVVKILTTMQRMPQYYSDPKVFSAINNLLAEIGKFER